MKPEELENKLKTTNKILSILRIVIGVIIILYTAYLAIYILDPNNNLNQF